MRERGDILEGGEILACNVGYSWNARELVSLRRGEPGMPGVSAAPMSGYQFYDFM
jgi:hypothetical protein